MRALTGLLCWPPLRRPVGEAADGLLAPLSLLFVPVGVAMMVHGALQLHPDAGAYAGLALGLQVVLASLLLPLPAPVIARWLGG